MKNLPLVKFWKNWSRKKKIFFIALASILLLFYFSLPKELFNNNYSTVIYDSQNRFLGASIAKDGQWRFPYSDSIPSKFQKCIIEFEDRYFQYHPGINAVSVTKSLFKNIKIGKKVSGGSTITMQVVRLSRGNPNRTYLEKIIEMWFALRIECSYSKKSILNYYACNAPFGGNVVGLHAASWRYFGRDPVTLSWAESALLAVLPNAPSLIYPGKNHERLLQKRNRLLERLYKNGVIDSTTYKLSLCEKLPEKPVALPQTAPHLLQRAGAENGYGKIYQTTLVKEIQEKTTLLLEKHLNQMRINQINNGCALVIDTKTGNVLAYVGNSITTDKQDNNDVDIIKAPRSSGSILKPILYGLLINEGRIAPNSLIEDVPVQIGSYAPKNFNISYDGLVPASQALARSLNVPAVKMLQQYGVPSFLYQLKKLGFTTINRPASHYGLSLILGGAEVTPWDLGNVYSYLGRTLISYNQYGGYDINDLRPIKYLKKSNDFKVIPNKAVPLSAGSLWTTFSAMTELARPEEYINNSTFSSLNRIAWKTGTSFGFRDAWAVGLNQKYTVVVWIGNADGEGRQGLVGIKAAAPLLFSIFNTLDQQQWFQKPLEDLIAIDVCKESGFRVSESCLEHQIIQAPRSVLKSPLCTFHKLIHTDSTGKYQVNSLCYSVSKMQHKSYMILTPIQEYFYKQHHMDYISPPPYMDGCIDDATIPRFDILYPRNGFKIYLPVDEKGQRSQLIMNATNRKANAKLYWYIDKEYIGMTTTFHQMAVTPEKGKHILEVIEERGNGIKVSFEIVDKQKDVKI